MYATLPITKVHRCPLDPLASSVYQIYHSFSLSWRSKQIAVTESSGLVAYPSALELLVAHRSHRQALGESSFAMDFELTAKTVFEYWDRSVDEPNSPFLGSRQGEYVV